MIRECISGVETLSTLSKESGMSANAIRIMVGRYKDRFQPILLHSINQLVGVTTSRSKGRTSPSSFHQHIIVTES
ncbi:MAG: hypothetical protein EOO91_15675 [Pedobacter sp.]|nr:MAG: hypothetical protein EOO91_15675 [Pedobacter sp.]